MVYKRKGRPTYSFQARTETGFKQLGTLAKDKALASRIETMWETLATTHRAWDVLGRVLSGEIAILALYDLWTANKYDVTVIRRQLDDVDLRPLFDDFLASYAKAGKAPTTVQHVTTHLAALVAPGERLLRSSITPALLHQRLYEYNGEAGTLRKVHSAWSVAFDYCVRVRHVLEHNPMDVVDRPPAKRPQVTFYELDTVEAIIGKASAQDAALGVLCALLYGTGGDLSPSLTLTRDDVDPASKSVRIAGTKAHTRDRIARVADWAWPTVWAHAKTMLPGVRLFPEFWSRWTVSDWHRAIVTDTTDTGLRLSVALPLRNARHHWAVRALRSGTPVGVVQRQLGHSTAKLTLDVYGVFIPSGHDRDQMEARATEYESHRRSAKDSAKTNTTSPAGEAKEA